MLSKRLFALLALVLMGAFLAACSDDDTGGGGGETVITLPAGAFTAATTMITTPGDVVMGGDDADWDITAGDVVKGVAVVADPDGEDAVYFVLVPAMMKTNGATYMTNAAKLTAALRPKYVFGWCLENNQNASTTVTETWYNDYIPFLIGEPGSATATADRIGNFYGQPAGKLTKVGNGAIGGNDAYAIKVGKGAMLSAISAWGGASSSEFKFGFVNKGDTAAVNDGTTVGYVFSPSRNFSVQLADIPSWNAHKNLVFGSSSPAASTTNVFPGADMVLTFAQNLAASNVSAGDVASWCGIQLENVTDGGAAVTAIGATVSGTVLTLDGADLNFVANKTYRLTINKLASDQNKGMTAPIVITFGITPTPNVEFDFLNCQRGGSNFTGLVTWPGDWNGWNQGAYIAYKTTLTAGAGNKVVYMNPTQFVAGRGFKVTANGSWDESIDGYSSNATIDLSGLDPVTEYIEINGGSYSIQAF